MAEWRGLVTGMCRAGEWCARAALGLAGILVLVLAAVTVGLVIARYCWGWTSNGLDELRWYLFGAIFLLAMAGCLQRGGHVRVDVFQQRFSPRVRAGIDLVLTLLMVIPLCVIVLMYGTAFARSSWRLPSGRAADHWAQTWSGGAPTSLTYRVVAPVEGVLRATVLRGERSANEGGLEARWLVKALIPLGFLLLGLQALAHCGRQVLILWPDPRDRDQDPEAP